MKSSIEIKKVTEIHEIDFYGQKIIGSYEQLEKLCLALEQYLFDEPTYDKLSEKVSELTFENERLKKELEEYEEETRERLRFQPIFERRFL